MPTIGYIYIKLHNHIKNVIANMREEKNLHRNSLQMCKMQISLSKQKTNKAKTKASKLTKRKSKT